MRYWNEKSRLLLTLELAVILPAAALVFLSAWQLKSIQRDRSVQAAFQRDFTQMLKITEKQMNQRVHDLTSDFRQELNASGPVCAQTMDRLLPALPYATGIYVYSPKTGFIFRGQPDRMGDPRFKAEADDFSGSLQKWLPLEYKDEVSMLTYMAKSNRPYHFGVNTMMRNGKDVYDTYSLLIANDNAGGEKLLAGFMFDPDYLRNQLFPQMLDAAVGHHEQADEKNPIVMMLHMRSESTPIATSAGWDAGEPEVERPLEGAFPGLVLAVKMRGTTLAAIESHFVKSSFITLGSITLLLIAGLVFTHRSVVKEMALARLKSDFVSNVSHELRTPLALIRLYSETLEMGRLKEPAKQQEYYEIIRKESERLSALINNILDFSRIEAGRKEYDFRETDVRELVRTTLDAYRYQIEQSGFTFEESIDENVPAMKVDREAISRSLLNLVNNALKYSPDHKYIGVNLTRRNGSVQLQVVDHGMGIPREEQSKIFEKFYRVGDPMVNNTRGSGLGLSLVRHIVQAHGGTVTVESAPGEGSKFTITLPVDGAREKSRAAAEGA
ncbi:MAG TPA: HAMP domain-containing sensor histidine kinase [Terriglobales bacterium]|nr:HAMP domain-containing sensor histidine kinase [Terriglobales bacterium]